MNSLLYSIRSFKVGDPAFTFDYESKGFDRSVWSKIEETSTDSQIHFIASKDFENVNFFQNMFSTYDFSNLKVYINGELTNQVANSISAKAGDDIIIKATDDHYPWFGGRSRNNIDYIKSIEEPLPLMYDSYNKSILSFEDCFYKCESLTSIPKGLFDNNPQVTRFIDCFRGCSNLATIPEGLFDNNPQVTNFYECFYNCTKLTSIPEGLFDNNTKVTNFSWCFNSCANLIVNVQIGSTASSINASYFASDTKEKGTVYCKEGSAACTAFSENVSTNVNVLTY